MQKTGELVPEEDSSHILPLIREGEGQTLEFKFEIADAKKFARTLVAFANTSGGTILIGVKDNGAISGIRSDEEYYMLDAAASMYCKPVVPFTTRLHDLEGKLVLEITIEPGTATLYKAPDKDGNYKVFIRKNAENLLPGGIYIKIHNWQHSGKPAKIAYSNSEQLLLRHLDANGSITLNQFRKRAGISLRKAEQIIINFVLLGIIEIATTIHGHTFHLINPEKSAEIIKKISL